jgi:hypothetical protein
MPFGIADFQGRATRLLGAADEFHDSLADDDVARDEAEARLLAAATFGDSGPLNFQTTVGAEARASLADELAYILSDLQSGNLLVASELKKRDRKTEMFDSARDQILVARADIAAPPSALRFADKLNVESATLDSAKEAFRNYSDQLLSEIVEESLETIKSAIDGVAKLGLGKLGDALEDVGKDFPLFADAARLARSGFENIKKAVDALISFIGKDAIDDVKKELGELWDRIGQGGKAVLAPILFIETVKARIQQTLAAERLETGDVDRATNALAPLAGRFSRENKLLRLLLTGLGLAAKLLAVFNFIAGPGLVAIGAAYLAGVGAVVVVGGEYTGGRRWLARVDGVEQIAEAVRPHHA